MILLHLAFAGICQHYLENPPVPTEVAEDFFSVLASLPDQEAINFAVSRWYEQQENTELDKKIFDALTERSADLAYNFLAYQILSLKNITQETDVPQFLEDIKEYTFFNPELSNTYSQKVQDKICQLLETSESVVIFCDLLHYFFSATTADLIEFIKLKLGGAHTLEDMETYIECLQRITPEEEKEEISGFINTEIAKARKDFPEWFDDLYMTQII